MRRISTQVVFETGDGSWTGDIQLKVNGILLSHIKKHHTGDGEVNRCAATIAFRKKSETKEARIYKAFFPPILEGKNIVSALEKNLCPFCETRRAEEIRKACLSNGEKQGAEHYMPDHSDYRYEIGKGGRLKRYPAASSDGSHPGEWFDFQKGFWITES